jgi:hypothetical protein
MRQSRVSCSLISRAAALTGIAVTSVMASASNSSVKPDSGRAHGTLISLTPQLGQSEARRARRQVSLVLKEIEMPPSLHHRVVRRAVGARATRARKTTTFGEVDLDVETLLVGVELARFDQPRRDETKRQLEQIGITHRQLPHRHLTPDVPPLCRRARGRQDQARRAAASGQPVLTAAARVGCGDGRSRRRDGLQIEQRDGPEVGKCSGAVTLPTQNSEEADLDGAEAMYRQSLAIDEVLGRKEGMAVNYGDLGSVLQERGDMASACAHRIKARDLFREIGAKPMEAQLNGWLKQNGCGGTGEA